MICVVVREKGSVDGPEVYTVYPASSVLAYESVTIIHFIVAGVGMFIGYSQFSFGYLIAIGYLAFAFGQMYLIMPFKVCPHCPYTRLKDARCVSGLNRLSRRVAGKGDLSRFDERAIGILCHNNLYLASQIAPIPIIATALVLDPSLVLAVLLAAVILFLVARVVLFFKRLACPHCAAKKVCPNAKMLGLQ